jgi:hypothetical protein
LLEERRVEALGLLDRLCDGAEWRQHISKNCVLISNPLRLTAALTYEVMAGDTVITIFGGDDSALEVALDPFSLAQDHQIQPFATL